MFRLYPSKALRSCAAVNKNTPVDHGAIRSQDVDHTERHSRHNGRRDADPQEDRRDRLFQPQVQHRCHQRACPGACPRERNRHQDTQADGAVFAHQPPLQVGFFLQRCWADLNRRPHPYQIARAVILTVFRTFCGLFYPLAHALRRSCFHCFRPLISPCGSRCGSRYFRRNMTHPRRI